MIRSALLAALLALALTACNKTEEVEAPAVEAPMPAETAPMAEEVAPMPAEEAAPMPAEEAPAAEPAPAN